MVTLGCWECWLLCGFAKMFCVRFDTGGVSRIFLGLWNVDCEIGCGDCYCVGWIIAAATGTIAPISRLLTYEADQRLSNFV